jgi:succinate dehydrogenase / fumarate reductase, cytochrome b subunit
MTVNQPSSSKWWRWFDPRGRKLGTLAFILNRITGLGLTLYLCMHLFMLGKLAEGPDSYNAFIALAHDPLLKFGEMFVIAAVAIHGLNGLRIAITSFGIAVPHQKRLFSVLMVLAGVIILFFGYKMFLGD